MDFHDHDHHHDHGHIEWVPTTPALLAQVDQNMMKAREVVDTLTGLYGDVLADPRMTPTHAIMEVTAVALSYPGNLAPYLGMAIKMLSEERDAVADKPPAGRCEWFAMCGLKATAYRTHPVLGRVPVCGNHTP